MVSRTPPESVRRYLRQEVNFGCPVLGCGNPFLSWHHFDPNWSVKHHHNPEGMIALCLDHAAKADGCAWTASQLRQMKQSPYVTDKTKEERYHYLRKDTVCLLGNNVAFHVKNVLTIDGERVIGFERDSDGYDRLNILLRDSEGQIILQMENNDWTAYPNEVFDLNCPPQGKELQIISKDKRTDFAFRFGEYSLFGFGNLLSSGGYDSDGIMDFMIASGCKEYVPVWTMTGTLLWGHNHLRIDMHGITEMNLQNSITRSSVIGRNLAVCITHGTFSLG